jgi:hypothetical protein
MNHNPLNIITKGLINSFPLTNGLITFTYEIIHTTGRKHGSGNYINLYNDVEKIGIDNINSINVHVDWFKKVNRNKYISAEIIEKKISVELINKFGKDVKINVEFLK